MNKTKIQKAMRGWAIKVAFLSVMLLGTSSSTQAALVKYNLDPDHTAVTWFATHLGFSTLNGKFTYVKGTLWLDEKDPTKSKVEARINVKGLSTGHKTLDEHLSKSEWLDSGNFGEATFVSNKIVKKGKNKAQVHGILNFHGHQRPVVLDVTLNKIGESPMDKVKRVGFSATGQINRKDFGMNTFSDPGGVGTEIKLVIDAEATIAE